jgi:hypothetical protein
VVLLAPASTSGLAFSPAAKTATAHEPWTPPRTADGQPDLQGVWTNNSVTPLERPKDVAAKEFYTDAEMQALAKRERERLSQIEDEGQPLANHSGVEGAPADDVHYDFSQFGLDRGLTLGARCLARPNVAPLLPTAYNSNLQIVQGRGYVAIETEEIHDVRMIPTDGRPHIPKSIRQWYGDSVGHWEGNTLVIDTTNFTDLSPFRGAQNLHMIERLTRADEDTILYQFTVEDPGMWTKPWSGELPIVKIQGQLYEYACHEANYALADTLRGARVAEEQAAKKSAK